MKKAMCKILIGIIAAILIFIVWNIGVKLDSLMTVRTEFYYVFHYWASIIGSIIAGITAGAYFE